MDFRKNNFTDDVLFTHLAVIGDYVALCLTFLSPNGVPAGNDYHVSKIILNQIAMIVIAISRLLHCNKLCSLASI